MDGRPFLRTQINDELIDVVQFYGDCVDLPESAQITTPGALPLALIGQLTEEQNGAEQKLQALLARIFGGSEEVINLTIDIYPKCHYLHFFSDRIHVRPHIRTDCGQCTHLRGPSGNPAMFGPPSRHDGHAAWILSPRIVNDLESNRSSFNDHIPASDQL